MLPLFSTTFIEYKTLRTEPSIRVTFDIGEQTPMSMAALHQFRSQQNANLIICNDEDFASILELTGNAKSIPQDLKRALMIKKAAEEEQERDVDVHDGT